MASISLKFSTIWLQPHLPGANKLTHWGRVTHICVGKLTTIGSDNVLSPGRRQAIIWTNDGILLFQTLGTNLSEILSEIHSFSFKKTHLKLSSAKWRLSRLGLNELSYLISGPRQLLHDTFLVITLPTDGIWVNTMPTKKSPEPCVLLTPLPMDKMDAVLADDNFRCISFNENDRISIRISLKFVPRSSIYNKPALVQVMAWRWTGDKPFMITWTNADQVNWRIYAALGGDSSTHHPLVPHRCVKELGQHRFR